MTRQTSILAYHEIKNNGLLGKLQLLVYECIYTNGPLTQIECVKKLDSLTDHGITPRFAELKKQGVIKEIGKRKCSITGRTVLEWDVTDKVPMKFNRPKPLKVQVVELEAKVKSLEKIIEDLKEKLGE